MQDFSTRILVVAAALIRPDGRVLMQRRRLSRAHGGLWEFPGGKVEPGETATAALAREIAEELGLALDPAALAPLSFATDETGSADRADPSRPAITILLYTCRRWHGTPECRDAEEIAWFHPGALAGLAMPPPDYPLATALLAII